MVMKTLYGRLFGEFLVDKKVITRGQLREALEMQKQTRKPLGLLGVDLGYLRAGQVVEVLREQRGTEEPFGRLAVARGFLTQEQLQELLDRQAESHLFLGEALVRMGVLTYGRLETLLDAFHPENEHLAASLVSSFSTIPQGQTLKVIVETVHRLLYRAISGHVRVGRVEPTCFGLRDIACTVLITRDDPPQGFGYGLALTRPVLLSLVYCLLQRSTWSSRLIDQALTDFAGVVDYALSRKLPHLHVRHSQPGIEVSPGLDIPRSRSACVTMSSTIGTLNLVFTPG